MEDEINNIINSNQSIFPMFIRKQATNLISEHKEIFSELDIKKNIKKIHSNLVDYINLKKSKIKLKELKEKKNMRKLILI